MYQLDKESFSINASGEWDSELFYELMNGKVISTKEASEHYDELVRVGALQKFKNHYHWAMLCIAYALNKKLIKDTDTIKATPKSRSTEIEFKICFQKQSHLWLAILSENLFALYPNKKVGKDELYQYMTALWHFGACELWAFWLKCKDFRDTDLGARKEFAEGLVELAYKNTQSVQSAFVPTQPKTEQNSEQEEILKQAFVKLGIAVKLVDFKSKGLRYDCYLVQLSRHYNLVNKKDEVCSALGKNESSVIIESADGVSFGYLVKILRSQNEWVECDKSDLEQALRQFNNPNQFKLPICIGIDEQGNAIFRDLFDAPHLFITGATKSGKSACMRGLLQSLFTLNDDSTKIEVAILDKARVDYVCFENEQNLMLNQPIKDTDKMLEFLNDCLIEMDDRLEQMEYLGITNWADFRKTNPQPYRIIVIDELAGLVKVNKEVSKVLERLTAEARKTGFHLILSTQTANSENFSQTLRLNVPSRLAMKVDTADQSRTALDTAGAESLLGKGDHLIKWVGEPIVFAHSYNL